MTGIIYCYTNKFNGKKYVGQTINTIAIRAGLHGRKYIRTNSKFGKAIKKYGWDAFEAHILETLDLPKPDIFIKLNELERFYISQFDSYKHGYNASPGGDGRGRECSEETRERIRQAQFNRPPASEETRRKISEAQKGKKKANTENYKKAAAKRKGIPLSEETRIKLSASQRARAQSDTYVHPNAGKHLSEATRQKLSIARKGKVPWNKGKQFSGRAIRCIETDVIYESIVIAAEAVGTSAQNISQVLRGKAKKAKGYHWEYYIEN